jgi:hypothetical protein
MPNRIDAAGVQRTAILFLGQLKKGDNGGTVGAVDARAVWTALMSRKWKDPMVIAGPPKARESERASIECDSRD